MKFYNYHPNNDFYVVSRVVLCEYCWPGRGIQNSEWTLKSFLSVCQILLWDSHCKEWIQALLELHALSRFLDVKTKKDRVYSHPLWRPCVLLQVCEVCVQTCVRREAVLYCAQVMRGICVTWTHHEMPFAVRAQIVAARSHHEDGASGNMLWCASHATLPLKP